MPCPVLPVSPHVASRWRLPSPRQSPSCQRRLGRSSCSRKPSSSGSRIEQEIDSVPATLTVITDETIARENPTDLDDLLKHEAGVSVRSQPNRSSGVFRAVGRAGNEGVNIRGLEGDQVRLQVDGVALPMTYSSGPYAAGRGDVIDPEGYKQVEILRGAASTQFGSDGLAGAVSFRTKDPADLLTLGKDVQGNIKLAYASANREWQFAPLGRIQDRQRAGHGAGQLPARS
jgi:hemoglobin/transferrin/lactoferrin receptor protein